MSKFGEFFKNFGKNFVGDPVSTLTGLAMIAGGAYSIYQNPASYPVAAAVILKGIHSVGTDSTGTTTPSALQAEDLVTTAAALAPQILTVADHVKAVKAAGDDAAATLALIGAVAPLLAPAAAPVPVAPVTVNVVAAPVPDAPPPTTPYPGITEA